MAFKPSMRRSRPPEDRELDVTPIMNLMVVLIPLLLAGAKFSEMALLKYLPPAEAATAADAGAPPEEGGGQTGEGKLNLLINIVDTGLQVSLFHSIEPGPHFYEIPLDFRGGYDWKALNDSLARIKVDVIGPPIPGKKTPVFSVIEQDTVWIDVYKYSDASEVSITALGNIHFQTIINAMDACQNYVTETGVEKELFPVPILKQFQ